MPLQVLRLAFGESRNSRLHPLLLKTKARIMETRSKKTILKSERTFEKKKGKNDENKSVVFAKNLPRRYSAATRATRSAGESFCVIAKSPKPTKYSLRSTIH
ncbi:hypothetical protein Y032_0035g3083 [Ancylostoma ceylanicum]|uniref:Uncharacterized protein n=1 Tax=Ancylostoma ceylanicum TaxID=53326 RepID=A0A016UKT4_9BILA|nr:hypothetical protein Y032_0035g3083 [Ancylostoma ceylanicum]